MKIKDLVPNTTVRSGASSLAVSIVLSLQFFAVVGMAQVNAATGSDQTSLGGEEQWRALFKAAKAAYSERRYTEAKSLLLKAGAIKMTPKIIANLAQVEIQLGEFRAAATHATEALAALGSNEGTEKDLATASKHVAKLTLNVNVAGAKLMIDGEEVGVSPLPKPLFVDAGARTLSAAKPGYVPMVRELIAQRAATQTVELELVAEATGPNGATATPMAAVPPATPAQPEALQPRTTQPQPRQFEARTPPTAGPNALVLVAGGAVAMAGVVTGLYFHAQANSHADSADARTAGLGRSGCYQSSGSPSADCSKLMDERKAQDSTRNLSTLAFVVGGAAWIATATYWIWPRRTPATAQVRIEGAVASGSSWLGLAGDF